MFKIQSISLYIFLVYTISVLLRILLAWQTFDSPLHTFEGEFLSILTYDAALYGYYASLFLEGLPHTKDVYLIEYLIYYIVTLTPFNLDQVMYYTPAFLSALIVIPSMLITSLYIHNKTITILVGLVSGIGYGFYSRSYLGYFDTDVLNLFFPMFILYGMIITIKKTTISSVLIIIISTILYLYWYQSSRPLIYSIYLTFVIYLSIAYIRKYKTFLLSYPYYLGVFILGLSIFSLYALDLEPFVRHINRYIIDTDILHISNYNFISPMQYTSEVKSTNIYHISHLISGNIVLFVTALLGYILLLYKHKEIIISLPMVILGFLSIYVGVRFHIYAIPILIISYFYLLYSIYIYTKKKKNTFLVLLLFFTLPTLYENFNIVKFFNTEVAIPVFTPEQVAILKKLKTTKKDNSYAISWWDYGYTIRYYSGLNTMIDNGRHRADSYTVANILLSDSQKFTHHASHYFYNLFDKQPKNAIVQAFTKYKTPTRLFRNILHDTNLSKNRHIDKYIILPSQLDNLIYTMYKFANIDPHTSKVISNHIYKMFTKQYEDKNFIYLSDSTKIEKNTSTLIIGRVKKKIKRISQVQYKNHQKVINSHTVFNKGLNLIVNKNQYYIMDDYFYNSSVVQMLFFNKYNKKYFSPFYIGKSISIYKVK